MQATIFEKIEQQPRLSKQDLQECLITLGQRQLEKLETVASKIKEVQENVAEAKNTLIPSTHDLQAHLDTFDQRQSEQLNTLAVAVKDIQEHVSEIKNIFAPVENTDETFNDEEFKKLSKNAKTLSERYLTSIITLNTRYHNTVDRQVKESFQLTRISIFVGLGLFVLTVISFLVTLFFFSDKMALITNGAGAVLSAIATGIGGWNKIHDDAAKRQLQTLSNLTSSVRATHGQFVIEQVQDETWKKTQYERLLSQLASNNTQN